MVNENDLKLEGKVDVDIPTFANVVSAIENQYSIEGCEVVFSELTKHSGQPYFDDLFEKVKSYVKYREHLNS